MTAIVLLNWIAPALLTPFGRAELGASDVAKFLAISGVAPWALAAVVGAITAAAALLAVRYLRLSDPSATV